MIAALLLLLQQHADFERDVLPLLSGRCLSCHGPGTAKGGLSFDSRERATAKLKSGGRAVVPGEPDRSALLERVLSQDPEERMPPKGEPLSGAQVKVLRDWIRSGAPWPQHWAYRPLARAEPPDDPWARNPVDRFVVGALRERGLKPSAEADRRTLLRRLSFDLTGLPPEPDGGEPYEAVVDRLLASPRYGERWARHWMDVVHFAETHGHDQDRPRENAWPYRDYLIRSFNSDKPYARFVQEQVAGDVLFPGDPWALVATGFLAAGPWDESSLRDIQAESIDRKVGQYLDRDDIVAATMTTFASTTVHCARCHDHKFDPVPTADYYSLQAVFSGIDKAERSYEPDPAAGARRRELAERLKDPAPATPQEIAEWLKGAEPAPAWRPVELVSAASESGSVLVPQPDGSVLATGPCPDRDVYVVVVRTGLPKVTGVRVEVLPHPSLPKGGPGRAVNGNLHLSELEVSAGRRLALQAPRADFDQAGWESSKVLDGDPTTAWGIHPQEGKAHRVWAEVKEPAEGGEWTFLLKQLHGRNHLIGHFRIWVTDSPAPLGGGDRPADGDALARHVSRKRLERELAALPPPAKVYCGTPDFEPDGSFVPAGKPRPVHVLQRGDIRKPGPEASPGALTMLKDVPFEPGEGEGARRAALGRWLSDGRNVLTWRSIANRVWQYHVGTGLVDTPGDFGRMGGRPSHPGLLDWLALELQRNGGSLKALHRVIVTSSTYRQSSAHVAGAAGVDADNRLLWRMNRRRLEAEAVHDAVLHAAGTLDPAMGGPSVKLFIQKPGIHVTPLVDYQAFNADDPGHRRRSVYRFVFRTLPDPFMEALDCPDASLLAGKREASVTALQALSLLNDKFMVRQSELLAERLVRESPDPAGRIARLFRLALQRDPSPREAAATAGYAAEHGLAHACRFVLNSNEFLFVD